MLTAAAASRMPSTFSGLAPQHHKQPFPWCSQIPKGELSNSLNSTCYRPSALGHAWHGEELRVANTTTGKLSDWRRGSSALCPPLSSIGPCECKGNAQHSWLGDTGEGWRWAWTFPAPQKPGFLVADRPSGGCLKLFTCPCTVCQGQQGLTIRAVLGLVWGMRTINLQRAR